MRRRKAKGNCKRKSTGLGRRKRENRGRRETKRMEKESENYRKKRGLQEKHG